MMCCPALQLSLPLVNMKDGALFEASRLMEAAENRIVATQMNKSLQEPPWDGACVPDVHLTHLKDVLM